MDEFEMQRINYLSKLIKLVKLHPILWDRNNVNYKTSKTEKISAWHAVAAQMNYKINIVRRSWESLRSQYRRVLKRISLGKKARWRHFSEMDFLRDITFIKKNEFDQIEISNSEDNATDSQELHKLNSPIVVAAATTTIPTMTTCSTSTLLPSTSAASILPCQPPNGLETNSYGVRNASPSSDDLEFLTNSDSSNSSMPDKIKTVLTCENVGKQKPAVNLDPHIDTAAARVEQQGPNKHIGNFQESSISTSCHIRPRMSVEETSEILLSSTLTSQIRPQSHPNMNEDDYYFVMSLLPYLRQTPGNLKLPLRMDIMKVIEENLDLQ